MGTLVGSSVNTQYTSTGTACAVTIPAGVQSGDIILVFLGHGNAATHSNTTTGFTEDVTATNGTACTAARFSKTADGTEGSTTFNTTLSSNSTRFLVCEVWRGVTLDTPTGTPTNTGASTTPGTAAVTASGQPGVLVGFGAGRGAADGTTVTVSSAPSTYTIDQQQTSGLTGTNRNTGGGTWTKTNTSTTVSAASATFNQSTSWATIITVLIDVAAAGFLAPVVASEPVSAPPAPAAPVLMRSTATDAPIWSQQADQALIASPSFQAPAPVLVRLPGEYLPVVLPQAVDAAVIVQPGPPAATAVLLQVRDVTPLQPSDSSPAVTTCRAVYALAAPPVVTIERTAALEAPAGQVFTAAVAAVGSSSTMPPAALLTRVMADPAPADVPPAPVAVAPHVATMAAGSVATLTRLTADPLTVPDARPVPTVTSAPNCPLVTPGAVTARAAVETTAPTVPAVVAVSVVACPGVVSAAVMARPSAESALAAPAAVVQIAALTALPDAPRPAIGRATSEPAGTPPGGAITARSWASHIAAAGTRVIRALFGAPPTYGTSSTTLATAPASAPTSAITAQATAYASTSAVATNTTATAAQAYIVPSSAPTSQTGG